MELWRSWNVLGIHSNWREESPGQEGREALQYHRNRIHAGRTPSATTGGAFHTVIALAADLITQI